jgi:hypothetical protein
MHQIKAFAEGEITVADGPCFHAADSEAVNERLAE